MEVTVVLRFRVIIEKPTVILYSETLYSHVIRTSSFGLCRCVCVYLHL